MLSMTFKDYMSLKYDDNLYIKVAEINNHISAFESYRLYMRSGIKGKFFRVRDCKFLNFNTFRIAFTKFIGGDVKIRYNKVNIEEGLK